MQWTDGEAFEERTSRSAASRIPTLKRLEKSRNHFPFLELAPELRNRIYHFYMLAVKDQTMKKSIAPDDAEKGTFAHHNKTKKDAKASSSHLGAQDHSTAADQSVLERTPFSLTKLSRYVEGLKLPTLPPVQEPALTRVCYRIRFEALSMWYSHFTVVITIRTRLEDFMEARGGLLDTQTTDALEPGSAYSNLTRDQIRMAGKLRFVNVGTIYKVISIDDPFYHNTSTFIRWSVIAGLKYEAFFVIPLLELGTPLYIPLESTPPREIDGTPILHCPDGSRVPNRVKLSKGVGGPNIIEENKKGYEKLVAEAKAYKERWLNPDMPIKWRKRWTGVKRVKIRTEEVTEEEPVKIVKVTRKKRPVTQSKEELDDCFLGMKDLSAILEDAPTLKFERGRRATERT